MEVLVFVLIVGLLVMLTSKPQRPSTPPQLSRNSFLGSDTQNSRDKRSSVIPHEESRQQIPDGEAKGSSDFSRSTEGYIPDDRCERCGREWVKLENSQNGGRFFTCSGWPKCDNTRERQIREKYCSNGHRRTSANTTYTASGHRRCLICRPHPNKK
jgi:hypothetical protein